MSVPSNLAYIGFSLNDRYIRDNSVNQILQKEDIVCLSGSTHSFGYFDSDHDIKPQHTLYYYCNMAIRGPVHNYFDRGSLHSKTRWRNSNSLTPTDADAMVDFTEKKIRQKYMKVFSKLVYDLAFVALGEVNDLLGIGATLTSSVLSSIKSNNPYENLMSSNIDDKYTVARQSYRYSNETLFTLCDAETTDISKKTETEALNSFFEEFVDTQDGKKTLKNQLNKNTEFDEASDSITVVEESSVEDVKKSLKTAVQSSAGVAAGKMLAPKAAKITSLLFRNMIESSPVLLKNKEILTKKLVRSNTFKKCNKLIKGSFGKTAKKLARGLGSVLGNAGGFLDAYLIISELVRQLYDFETSKNTIKKNKAYFEMSATPLTKVMLSFSPNDPEFMQWKALNSVPAWTQKGTPTANSGPFLPKSVAENFFGPSFRYHFAVNFRAQYYRRLVGGINREIDGVERREVVLDGPSAGTYTKGNGYTILNNMSSDVSDSQEFDYVSYYSEERQHVFVVIRDYREVMDQTWDFEYYKWRLFDFKSHIHSLKYPFSAANPGRMFFQTKWVPAVENSVLGPLFSRICRFKKKNPTVAMTLTGYSVGGGFAVELAHRLETAPVSVTGLRKGERVEVVTFGAVFWKEKKDLEGWKPHGTLYMFRPETVNVPLGFVDTKGSLKSLQNFDSLDMHSIAGRSSEECLGRSVFTFLQTRAQAFGETYVKPELVDPILSRHKYREGGEALPQRFVPEERDCYKFYLYNSDNELLSAHDRWERATYEFSGPADDFYKMHWAARANVLGINALDQLIEDVPRDKNGNALSLAHFSNGEDPELLYLRSQSAPSAKHGKRSDLFRGLVPSRQVEASLLANSNNSSFWSSVDEYDDSEWKQFAETSVDQAKQFLDSSVLSYLPGNTSRKTYSCGRDNFFPRPCVRLHNFEPTYLMQKGAVETCWREEDHKFLAVHSAKNFSGYAVMKKRFEKSHLQNSYGDYIHTNKFHGVVMYQNNSVDQDFKQTPGLHSGFATLKPICTELRTMPLPNPFGFFRKLFAADNARQSIFWPHVPSLGDEAGNEPVSFVKWSGRFDLAVPNNDYGPGRLFGGLRVFSSSSDARSNERVSSAGQVLGFLEEGEDSRYQSAALVHFPDFGFNEPGVELYVVDEGAEGPEQEVFYLVSPSRGVFRSAEGGSERTVIFRRDIPDSAHLVGAHFAGGQLNAGFSVLASGLSDGALLTPNKFGLQGDYLEFDLQESITERVRHGLVSVRVSVPLDRGDERPKSLAVFGSTLPYFCAFDIPLAWKLIYWSSDLDLAPGWKQQQSSFCADIQIPEEFLYNFGKYRLVIVNNAPANDQAGQMVTLHKLALGFSLVPGVYVDSWVKKQAFVDSLQDMVVSALVGYSFLPSSASQPLSDDYMKTSSESWLEAEPFNYRPGNGPEGTEPFRAFNLLAAETLARTDNFSPFPLDPLLSGETLLQPRPHSGGFFRMVVNSASPEPRFSNMGHVFFPMTSSMDPENLRGAGIRISRSKYTETANDLARSGQAIGSVRLTFLECPRTPLKERPDSLTVWAWVDSENAFLEGHARGMGLWVPVFQDSWCSPRWVLERALVETSSAQPQGQKADALRWTYSADFSEFTVASRQYLLVFDTSAADQDGQEALSLHGIRLGLQVLKQVRNRPEESVKKTAERVKAANSSRLYMRNGREGFRVVDVARASYEASSEHPVSTRAGAMQFYNVHSSQPLKISEKQLLDPRTFISNPSFVSSQPGPEESTCVFLGEKKQGGFACADVRGSYVTLERDADSTPSPGDVQTAVANPAVRSVTCPSVFKDACGRNICNIGFADSFFSGFGSRSPETLELGATDYIELWGVFQQVFEAQLSQGGHREGVDTGVRVYRVSPVDRVARFWQRSETELLVWVRAVEESALAGSPVFETSQPRAVFRMSIDVAEGVPLINKPLQTLLAGGAAAVSSVIPVPASELSGRGKQGLTYRVRNSTLQTRYRSELVNPLEIDFFGYFPQAVSQITIPFGGNGTFDLNDLDLSGSGKEGPSVEASRPSAQDISVFSQLRLQTPGSGESLEGDGVELEWEEVGENAKVEVVPGTPTPQLLKEQREILQHNFENSLPSYDTSGFVSQAQYLHSSYEPSREFLQVVNLSDVENSYSVWGVGPELAVEAGYSWVAEGSTAFLEMQDVLKRFWKTSFSPDGPEGRFWRVTRVEKVFFPSRLAQEHLLSGFFPVFAEVNERSTPQDPEGFSDPLEGAWTSPLTVYAFKCSLPDVSQLKGYLGALEITIPRSEVTLSTSLAVARRAGSGPNVDLLKRLTHHFRAFFQSPGTWAEQVSAQSVSKFWEFFRVDWAHFHKLNFVAQVEYSHRYGQPAAPEGGYVVVSGRLPGSEYQKNDFEAVYTSEPGTKRYTSVEEYLFAEVYGHQAALYLEALDKIKQHLAIRPIEDPNNAANPLESKQLGQVKNLWLQKLQRITENVDFSSAESASDFRWDPLKLFEPFENQTSSETDWDFYNAVHLDQVQLWDDVSGMTISDFSWRVRETIQVAYYLLYQKQYFKFSVLSRAAGLALINDTLLFGFDHAAGRSFGVFNGVYHGVSYSRASVGQSSGAKDHIVLFASLFDVVNSRQKNPGLLLDRVSLATLVPYPNPVSQIEFVLPSPQEAEYSSEKIMNLRFDPAAIPLEKNINFSEVELSGFQWSRPFPWEFSDLPDAADAGSSPEDLSGVLAAETSTLASPFAVAWVMFEIEAPAQPPTARVCRREQVRHVRLLSKPASAAEGAPWQQLVPCSRLFFRPSAPSYAGNAGVPSKEVAFLRLSAAESEVAGLAGRFRLEVLTAGSSGKGVKQRIDRVRFLRGLDWASWPSPPISEWSWNSCGGQSSFYKTVCTSSWDFGGTLFSDLVAGVAGGGGSVFSHLVGPAVRAEDFLDWEWDPDSFGQLSRVRFCVAPSFGDEDLSKVVLQLAFRPDRAAEDVFFVPSQANMIAEVSASSNAGLADLAFLDMGTPEDSDLLQNLEDLGPSWTPGGAAAQQIDPSGSAFYAMALSTEKVFNAFCRSLDLSGEAAFGLEAGSDQLAHLLIRARDIQGLYIEPGLSGFFPDVVVQTSSLFSLLAPKTPPPEDVSGWELDPSAGSDLGPRFFRIRKGLNQALGWVSAPEAQEFPGSGLLKTRLEPWEGAAEVEGPWLEFRLSEAVWPQEMFFRFSEFLLGLPSEITVLGQVNMSEGGGGEEGVEGEGEGLPALVYWDVLGVLRPDWGQLEQEFAGGSVPDSWEMRTELRPRLRGSPPNFQAENHLYSVFRLVCSAGFAATSLAPPAGFSRFSIDLVKVVEENSAFGVVETLACSQTGIADFRKNLGAAAAGPGVFRLTFDSPCTYLGADFSVRDAKSSIQQQAAGTFQASAALQACPAHVTVLARNVHPFLLGETTQEEDAKLLPWFPLVESAPLKFSQVGEAFVASLAVPQVSDLFVYRCVFNHNASQKPAQDRMLVPTVRWQTFHPDKPGTGGEKLLGFLARSGFLSSARLNLQGLGVFPEHVLTTAYDAGTGLQVEPAVFAPLFRPNEPAGTGQGVVVSSGSKVSSSAPVRGSLLPAVRHLADPGGSEWAASNRTEENLGARLLASAPRARVAGRGPRNLQPIPATAVSRAGATCGAAAGVRFTMVPPSDLPLFLDPQATGSPEMLDLRTMLEDLSFPEGKGSLYQSAVFPATEPRNKGWVCFAAWKNLAQICGGAPGDCVEPGPWEVPPVSVSSPLLLGFAQNVPAPEKLFAGCSNSRAVTRFQPVCDQVVHLRAPSLGKAGAFGHSDLFGSWGVQENMEQAGGSFWSAAVAAEDLGLGSGSSWLVTGNPRANGGQGAVSFSALEPHRTSVRAVFTTQPLVAQLGQLTAADIGSAVEVPSIPPVGCQMVEITSHGVFQAVWAAVQGFEGWLDLGKEATSLSRFYGHSSDALYFRVGTEKLLEPEWLQNAGSGFRENLNISMNGHRQFLSPQWFRFELLSSGGDPQRYRMLTGKEANGALPNAGFEFLGHSVEISPRGTEAFATCLADTAGGLEKMVRVVPFSFQKEHGWVMRLAGDFFETGSAVPFESFRLHLAPAHGLVLSSPLAPQVLVEKTSALDPGSEIPSGWESWESCASVQGFFTGVSGYCFSDFASPRGWGSGDLVAGVTSAGEVKIFSAAWQQTIPAPQSYLSTWTANRLAFSPDGDILAVALSPEAGAPGAVQLFRLRNGSSFEALGNPFAAGAGFGLAWDRLGRVLVARSGPQGQVVKAFRVDNCSGVTGLLRTASQGPTSQVFSGFSASGNVGATAGLSSVQIFYLGEMASSNQVEDFLQAPDPEQRYVEIEVEFSEPCSVVGFELVAPADSQTARKTFSKGVRVLVCAEDAEPELVFETCSPLEKLIDWHRQIPALSKERSFSSGPLLLKKQHLGIRKVILQVLRPDSLSERNLFGFSLSQLVFWQTSAGEASLEYLTDVSVPASGNSRFSSAQKQTFISEHVLKSKNYVPADNY